MSEDREQPLVVRCSYDAARERVFHAFTREEILVNWYTPDIANPVVFDHFEFKAGSGYRVRFGAPAGEQPYVEEGTYVSIDEPSKIVFTTVLSYGDEVLARTRNTIELIELDGGSRTELVMTELDSPAGVRQERFEGWSATVGNLPRALA